MQGDLADFEDPALITLPTIPLAHCVRPSPLKGGLTRRHLRSPLQGSQFFGPP